jgi:predicted dehydrogenase
MMGISLGLIGLGDFGRQFVKLYKEHPDVERMAVGDIDAERVARVAREHGIGETYASLDEMCRSDLDAIVIITQPWLHYEQVIQALEAGKHVYSAVPAVSGTGTPAAELLERCNRLVDTVKRTGQLYMLGETTFFRRETMYCRQRAAEGAFGRFTYGECEYWHDLDSPAANLREVARRRWGNAWGPDKTGGAPMHYPTHATSSMISIMRAHMTSVSARGYAHPNDDWFRSDTVYQSPFSNEVALYTMSNGALVRHSEFRRIGHPEWESFRLFGTEGSFVNDVSGPKWTTRYGWDTLDISAVGEALPEALAADPGGHGGSHAYLVNEFVCACRDGRQPVINVWEAVRYLAPGIVAHESARRDGETLSLPDWGDAPRP